MNLHAEIEGIEYIPLLCRSLREYDISNIDMAFESDTTFILGFEKDKKFAVSWWVSPKRTRSYPYARIYDSTAFQGKRVTVIPVFKDEGKEGDRDFIQWDTISLMSLLGIYVIISYYKDAEKNRKFKNKITKQKFDFEHIRSELNFLLNFQSDALHWNMNQIEKITEVAEKALISYREIKEKLKVDLHSDKEIEKRIKKVLYEKIKFINFSRNLAEKAQTREYKTFQPKESVSGQKALITIKNYLGGFYYLTCDELIIENDTVSLIECKHSKKNMLPSKVDIKDGLIKMILFTNLKNLKIDQRRFHHKSILKLTSERNFELRKLRNQDFIKILKIESRKNNFQIFINDINLETLSV